MLRRTCKTAIIFLVCLLSGFAAVCQDARFKVVGYYSLRAVLEGRKKVPFKRLTHINLWFLNPDTLGNFTQDLTDLRPFIAAAHRRDVKVLFSIGGGGPHPQYHKLLTDKYRPTLVRNLVSLTVAHGLDGVDVDLEGSDIDENYEDFVVELAIGLHQYDKLITAAIAVYYKDQLSDTALSQYDFVNVMSYDRTGPWRPDKPGPHAAYEAAVEDLEYFGSVRHIPKEKMTLGVPFYGYGYGPEPTSPAISMNFAEIVSSFPGAEKVDEWKMDDGKVLYYNGIPTIKRKTQLAREKAGGIMIWELRGDARGSKSLLKTIDRSY